MKNVWMMIGFVVLAAVVIGLGVWYGGQIGAPASQGIATVPVATTTAPTDTAQATTTPVATTTNSSTTTMNDLQIHDITVGTGTIAQNGDSVSVLYTGTLDNGTVFDASANHGNQPFTFTLGAGQVIKGWDMGVLGMKVGGKRELVIPASLGYGASGAGGVIPPNATLHFTVEVLSVNGQK